MWIFLDLLTTAKGAGQGQGQGLEVHGALSGGIFALPIVCLAFLNQTNIHGVVDEMEQADAAQSVLPHPLLDGALNVLYVVVGVLGYMRFGSLTRDNVDSGYTNLDWTNTVFFRREEISMAVSRSSASRSSFTRVASVSILFVTEGEPSKGLPGQVQPQFLLQWRDHLRSSASPTASPSSFPK